MIELYLSEEYKWFPQKKGILIAFSVIRHEWMNMHLPLIVGQPTINICNPKTKNIRTFLFSGRQQEPWENTPLKHNKLLDLCTWWHFYMETDSSVRFIVVDDSLGDDFNLDEFEWIFDK